MARHTEDKLASYVRKRDFDRTNEPRGDVEASGKRLSFVIQKHAASSLHYDFRLEMGGVLVSWAVPKGPSYDPADKRLAVHVEDHPLSYATFEGTIPAKQYGAGTVIVWDRGTWHPVGDPHAGLAQGKLVFEMQGQKMHGAWELVKIAQRNEKQEPWLLFKKRDAHARPQGGYDVVTALPDSVIRKPLEGVPTLNTQPPSATAVQTPLPEALTPQLATLATDVPPGGSWRFEIKLDGYRILARVDGGKGTLFTRSRLDWSDKMPTLVRAIEALPMRSGWIDGEIVMLDAQGLPSFNALQKAFDGASGRDDIVFFAFDLPFFQGHDLRVLPVVERRRLLKTMLDTATPSDRIRFSADIEGDAASVMRSACQMKLEGIIAKRSDAPYVSGRTATWLKLKCQQRQAFVIAGYTDRSDDSSRIGSLLLGVHAPSGALVSVGSVGTGWSAKEASALKARLKRLEQPSPPFDAGVSAPGRWSRRAAASERWVRPTLVAEVAFGEWTADAQIRHASYVGLRTDKPVESIQRGSHTMPTRKSRESTPGTVVVNGIAVTHGERVIDASTGLTKLDLVRYYASVADWLLPHLKARPVSLLRCPDGVEGPSFFQKHDEKQSIAGMRSLKASLRPEHPPMIEAPDLQAVLGAAQMNVIEFHTWNATTKALRQPDRMIFDLDPGEGTPWKHVQEAALMVRTVLTALGLEAWLKTSGGKGLHVVVPLARRLDHTVVKAVSRAIVLHLAKTVPSRIVAKSGPANRVGKIFVDYLRNGEGATTVAAFSARARPGMGVSMPVHWDALAALTGGAQFTVANAREHLSFERSDPWQDADKAKQTLAQAIKVLGVKV